MNISNSFNFFPLGVGKIWFSLELLEFRLGLLKDFLDAFLEKLNLYFRDTDDFNVLKNFLARKTVNDDCHKDHSSHVECGQLSESNWVVRVYGDHHG